MRLLAAALVLSACASVHAAHCAGPLFDAHLQFNVQAAKYPLLMGYRAWLGDLPPDVARRIAWDNGAQLFLSSSTR
jgi:hypothetical protein